jgi:hypothetical protein
VPDASRPRTQKGRGRHTQTRGPSYGQTPLRLVNVESDTKWVLARLRWVNFALRLILAGYWHPTQELVGAMADLLEQTAVDAPLDRRTG